MYFLAATAAHYADGGALGGVPSSGLFFGVSDGCGAADSGVDSAEGDGVSACNSGGIFSTTFDFSESSLIVASAAATASGATSADSGAAPPQAAALEASIISGVTTSAGTPVVDSCSRKEAPVPEPVDGGGVVGERGGGRVVLRTVSRNSSIPISDSSVLLNSLETSCSSRIVGWNAFSVCPRVRAASASPFGPKTIRETTPMTRTSGVPTPRNAEVVERAGAAPKELPMLVERRLQW